LHYVIYANEFTSLAGLFHDPLNSRRIKVFKFKGFASFVVLITLSNAKHLALAQKQQKPSAERKAFVLVTPGRIIS
jgi:hypothetical protein